MGSTVKEKIDDLVYEDKGCDVIEAEVSRVSVEKLRKCLQRFNEDLGQYINSDQRYKLGRVLTIIDASISDPEQRKAIKDLVNNEWWSDGNRASDGRMTNPHTDIRGLCLALGFELYDSSACVEPVHFDHEEWSSRSYEKTINEE